METHSQSEAGGLDGNDPDERVSVYTDGCQRANTTEEGRVRR